MIGTHNSLTYSKPRKWVMRLFKGIWKCQEKHITEQLKDGVKFFDIRVTLTDDGMFNSVAHGIVDFKIDAADLLVILSKIYLSRAYFRILIERGNCEVNDSFVHMYKQMFEKQLVEIRVKDTWEVLYKNPNINLEIKDLSFVPFASDKPWWKQSKRWRKIFEYPIKRWVKKNKVTLTKEQVDDPTVVYFVDYYNLNDIA